LDVIEAIEESDIPYEKIYNFNQTHIYLIKIWLPCDNKTFKPITQRKE
jgi:hypothetical protein